MLLGILLQATTLPCAVSWVGNSFSGADAWVQNFFVHMNVRPDGTCVTWSHWDESGQRFGQYRNGKVVGNEDVGANSLRTVDKRGRAWNLIVRYDDPEHQEYEFHPQRIECDGKTVEFPGLFEPTALAVANDGTLMVADSGASPRQQVLFYDVSNPQRPRLVRTFGKYGGIRSGSPGVVEPTKLWGIRGIGMDAKGNVYVAQSEMGTVLRAFSPGGKMLWQVYAHLFLDLLAPDPASDAGDLWGVQEHYRMDYRKSAGGEAKWVGYSLDRHRNPYDPRGLMFVKQQGEHGLTSCQVQTLGGKRFLFVGGAGPNFINVFRYDGEIARPSTLLMQWTGRLYNTDQKWPPAKPDTTFIWRDRNGDGQYQKDEYEPNTPLAQPGPFCVDGEGNIWMARGFYRYDFCGLDARGNPIYRPDRVTKLQPPEGMKSVSRVCVDRERDILVAAEEGTEPRRMGRIFVCKGYKAGNRKAIQFESGAGPNNAACVAVAGDYIFSGGWEAQGRVFVNRVDDGAFVGILEPDASVGGPEKTGWIDLNTGIAAYRRKNGEYLVIVEEDARGKNLLYRWRPR